MNKTQKIKLKRDLLRLIRVQSEIMRDVIFDTGELRKNKTFNMQGEIIQQFVSVAYPKRTIPQYRFTIIRSRIKKGATYLLTGILLFSMCWCTTKDFNSTNGLNWSDYNIYQRWITKSTGTVVGIAIIVFLFFYIRVSTRGVKVSLKKDKEFDNVSKYSAFLSELEEDIKKLSDREVQRLLKIM